MMAIVIQSRAPDDLIWRDEVWRRNHFTAFMTAKAKARLTGRIYRLVDQNGVVLEQVRNQPPSPSR
jgi:hypothetical protein